MDDAYVPVHVQTPPRQGGDAPCVRTRQMVCRQRIPILQHLVFKRVLPGGVQFGLLRMWRSLHDVSMHRHSKWALCVPHLHGPCERASAEKRRKPHCASRGCTRRITTHTPAVGGRLRVLWLLRCATRGVLATRPHQVTAGSKYHRGHRIRTHRLHGSGTIACYKTVNSCND